MRELDAVLFDTSHEFSCAASGNRTPNPLIKSQML